MGFGSERFRTFACTQKDQTLKVYYRVYYIVTTHSAYLVLWTTQDVSQFFYLLKAGQT